MCQGTVYSARRIASKESDNGNLSVCYSDIIGRSRRSYKHGFLGGNQCRCTPLVGNYDLLVFAHYPFVAFFLFWFAPRLYWHSPRTSCLPYGTMRDLPGRKRR